MSLPCIPRYLVYEMCETVVQTSPDMVTDVGGHSMALRGYLYGSYPCSIAQ